MRELMDICCGHCQAHVQVVLEAETSRITRFYLDPNTSEPRWAVASLRSDHEVAGKSAAVAMCPKCFKPNLLWYRRDHHDDGRTSSLTDIRQIPESSEPAAPAGWPEKVRLSWLDAQRSREVGMSAPARATAIGACLEASCRELGATGKNLAARINSLAENGIVTEPMQRWAHQLRLLRNAGAHEYEASEEEADAAFEFLRLFLELTFTLRLQIEQRLPE